MSSSRPSNRSRSSTSSVPSVVLSILFGFILCAVNIFMTARSGKATDATAEVVVLEREKKDRMGLVETFKSDPVSHVIVGIALMILWFFLPPHADKAAFVAAIFLVVRAVEAVQKKWQPVVRLLRPPDRELPALHHPRSSSPSPSAVRSRSSRRCWSTGPTNVEDRIQVLYTPLELAGRDLYVSEGCYNCHSQMIRTLVPDVMRYGPCGKPGLQPPRRIALRPSLSVGVQAHRSRPRPRGW